MITDSVDRYGSGPVPPFSLSFSSSLSGRTVALAQGPRTQDPWDQIPKRGASESDLTGLGSCFQHNRPASSASWVSDLLHIEALHSLLVRWRTKPRRSRRAVSAAACWSSRRGELWSSECRLDQQVVAVRPTPTPPWISVAMIRVHPANPWSSVSHCDA